MLILGLGRQYINTDRKSGSRERGVGRKLLISANCLFTSTERIQCILRYASAMMADPESVYEDEYEYYTDTENEADGEDEDEDEQKTVPVRKDSAWRRKFELELESDSGQESYREAEPSSLMEEEDKDAFQEEERAGESFLQPSSKSRYY